MSRLHAKGSRTVCIYWKSLVYSLNHQLWIPLYAGEFVPLNLKSFADLNNLRSSLINKVWLVINIIRFYVTNTFFRGSFEQYFNNFFKEAYKWINEWIYYSDIVSEKTLLYDKWEHYTAAMLWNALCNWKLNYYISLRNK